MHSLPIIPPGLLYPVTLTALCVLSALLIGIILFACVRHFRNNRVQTEMESLIPSLNALMETGKAGRFDLEEIKRVLPERNFEYFERHLRNKISTLDPLSVSVERELAGLSGFSAHVRERVRQNKGWKQAIALRTLSYLRDPADIPLFRSVLRESPFFQSLFAAAIGLALCNDTDSIDDILRRVPHRDAHNRDMLITALFPLLQTGADKMHRLLDKAGLRESEACVLIDLLREAGYKPVKDTLERLLRDTGSLEIKIHAIEALGALGDASTADALSPFLSDEDFRLRLKAVPAVAKLKGEAVLEATEKHLYDLNWWVRRTAAESLYRMGGRGVERLQSLAKDSLGFPSDIAKLILAEARFGRLRGEIKGV